MQRQIIKIDSVRCDGCGKCINGCPEGALQLIDGKARVVSEATCDGLGACITECPQNAITIEMREAEAYSESETLRRILPQGTETLRAHLRHLYDHAQTPYLEEALAILRAQRIEIPEYRNSAGHACPGAAHRSLPTLQTPSATPGLPSDCSDNTATHGLKSQLAQWPIQLHLIQPRNPLFVDQDLLLVADCVAFALPNFNQKYLPGKRLLVACPKLDQNLDVYVAKLTALIDDAAIRSLHVMIMEVPCCGGLLRLAETASRQSSRKLPIGSTVIGLDGELRRTA